jgi:hypothetical protein
MPSTLRTDGKPQMSDIEAIPINALFDSTGRRPNKYAAFNVRKTLQAADVIIGRDVMTGREFILYGRDAVERIAGTRDDSENADVIAISLDRDPKSDDLERIIALVKIVKGRHDYRAIGDV